jgi:hypothetical protein
LDTRFLSVGSDHQLPEPSFQPAALELIRAHPWFRDAAEAVSRGMVGLNQGLDDIDRWMLKDIGRTTLYLLVLMAESILPLLTVGDLCRFGVAVGAGSRGRVRAYVDFALANGRLELEPGDRPWTERRLIVRPSFRLPVINGLIGMMEPLGFVAPALPASAERLRRDVGVTAALVEIERIWMSAARLGVPRLPEIEFFLGRDGGMTVLNDLLLRQDPGRAALLEAAPLRRREISARYRISRGHLERVLKDAAAAGLLQVGAREIVFAPALSEAYTQWSAILLQALRRIAAAILAADEPVRAAHF